MNDKHNTVIDTLNKIFQSDGKKVYHLFKTKLINTGKITNKEIQSILSFTTRLEDVNIEILIWLYESIYNAYKLPKPSEYFNESEIKRADTFLIKRHQSNFPLRFKILDRLAYNDQFLISQTVQEIEGLKSGGIIIWDANMQRESVVTKVGNEMVTHIKYDDNRARTIGEKIANNEYWSNSLRWHLVVNGKEEYYIDDYENELVIKSGTIAEIDGQHRDKGSEYALIENPNVFLKFPIVFTIGTVQDGQSIIHQEEQRAPINKRHVQSYANTIGNSIVKTLKGSNKLDGVYKFCDTMQAVNSGAGFILTDIFSNSIEQYYSVKQISKKKENELVDWLIDFFNELADIFYDDFANYKNILKRKWNVSPYVFVGYIYLSSILKDVDDWKDKLKQTLNYIDFEGQPWDSSSKANKVVEKVFKGVI